MTESCLTGQRMPSVRLMPTRVGSWWRPMTTRAILAALSAARAVRISGDGFDRCAVVLGLLDVTRRRGAIPNRVAEPGDIAHAVWRKPMLAELVKEKATRADPGCVCELKLPECCVARRSAMGFSR